MRPKIFDFLDQAVVVRHTLVDVTYDAGLVDEISQPAAAIKLANRTIIDKQREVQSELFDEIFVGFQSIGTYTQNLGVKLFKALDIALKRLHFAGSARGEIGIIQGENDRTLL